MPSRFGIWMPVRLLFILLFVLCALADAMSEVHFRLPVLCLVFVFGILQTRFALLEAYRRLPQDTVWLQPDWRVSPFQTHQPFQFAHMAGYALGFCGLAAELREVVRRGELPPDFPVEMLAGIWGLGMLIGIDWAVRTYRWRFREVDAEAGKTQGAPSIGEME